MSFDNINTDFVRDSNKFNEVTVVIIALEKKNQVKFEKKILYIKLSNFKSRTLSVAFLCFKYRTNKKAVVVMAVLRKQYGE